MLPQLLEMLLHSPRSRALIPSESVQNLTATAQALSKQQPIGQWSQQTHSPQVAHQHKDSKGSSPMGQCSQHANSHQVAPQHKDSKGSSPMGQCRKQTHSHQVAPQHKDSKGSSPMGQCRKQTHSCQVAHQHKDSKGPTVQSRCQQCHHSLCMQQVARLRIRAPKRMHCQVCRKHRFQVSPDQAALKLRRWCPQAKPQLPAHPNALPRNLPQPRPPGKNHGASSKTWKKPLQANRTVHI